MNIRSTRITDVSVRSVKYYILKPNIEFELGVLAFINRRRLTKVKKKKEKKKRGFDSEVPILYQKLIFAIIGTVLILFIGITVPIFPQF